MNKSTPMCVIPTALIQDQSISIEARFLYVYLSTLNLDKVDYEHLSLNSRSLIETLEQVSELRRKGWLSYEDNDFTLYYEPIKE